MSREERAGVKVEQARVAAWAVAMGETLGSVGLAAAKAAEVATEEPAEPPARLGSMAHLAASAA